MEYPVKPNDVAAKLSAMGPVAYGYRETIDGCIYIACYTAAARAVGDCVCIGGAGTAGGKNPAVSVPATTAVPVRVGVCVTGTSGAGLVWVQIGPGRASAKVNGTTAVADGDAIQLSNGQVYAVKDGGSARTADTFAVAEGAVASGTVTVGIYLLDREATLG